MKINEDGSIETNEMLFHTGLDMCPYWLKIAWSNLLKTEQYHNKIVQQANSGSESKLGDYLQKEFQIGMQTIMAACIAMDAYYASIKPHSDIPDDVLSDWRFSTFRFANAKAILGNMLSIIYQTSRQKIPKEKVRLSVTSEKHKNEIDPLINKWVKRYGKLF